MDLDTCPKFNYLTLVSHEVFHHIPYMVMRIAIYGIVEDIRVEELNIWEIVQIHTRKLVSNRITNILNSFQVIVSFSQIMFPRQQNNMYTFKKLYGHF